MHFANTKNILLAKCSIRVVWRYKATKLQPSYFKVWCYLATKLQPNYFKVRCYLATKLQPSYFKVWRHLAARPQTKFFLAHSVIHRLEPHDPSWTITNGRKGSRYLKNGHTIYSLGSSTSCVYKILNPNSPWSSLRKITELLPSNWLSNKQNAYIIRYPKPWNFQYFLPFIT